MKLSSVRLQNFRCFEDTTIHFHEQLTVLVGGNGSGKTAVLDGLKTIVTPICSGRTKKSAPFYYAFNIHDANSIARDDGRMDFSVMLDEKNQVDVYSVRDMSRDKGMEYRLTYFYKNRPYYFPMDPFYDDDAQRGFEFCIYYRAHRSMKKHIPIVISREDNIEEIYEPASDIMECFEKTLNWFAYKEFEEAKQALKKKDMDHIIPELQAVRDGVALVLGDYEKPYTDKTPIELFVYKKGESTPYSLSQLSDGYRTMLALVMDLARRMAVVNAENYAATGKSVLESPAIVLIDEVELHLHPSWQQRVLPDLMRTFPNTQFIVTTHSPQVISSVKPENVRILSDGKVLPPEYSTYGAESSRVLEEVFGVETRSPHNVAKQALDKYFRLINDGLYNTPEAQSLREELETWLYDDPALLRADMLIDRLESRKARERNNA